MKILLALAILAVSPGALAKLSDESSINQAVHGKCGEVVAAKIRRLDKPGSPVDEIGDAEVDMLREEAGEQCFSQLQKFEQKHNSQLEYTVADGSIIFCGLVGPCFVIKQYAQ